MEMIKSYTSLEQSKKLAEILPIESADMWYQHVGYSYSIIDGKEKPVYFPMVIRDNISSDDIPCWSLAALLNVLPKKYYPIKDHETNLILGKPKDKWCVLYCDTTGMQDGEQTLGNNPVDACYEMIMKLHEQKLL